MTVVADYAALYEKEIRGRRRNPRYIWVLAVWCALFVVRPGLALKIWSERF